jgi:hypothetical protein
MSNRVIIYSKKDDKSIMQKFKAKKKYPNALIIESSNKEALSKALKGNIKEVLNFDEKLDKRHLKGDTVENEKKTTVKKIIPKKEAPKKSVEKKVAPKKVVEEKTTVKKKTTKK